MFITKENNIYYLCEPQSVFFSKQKHSHAIDTNKTSLLHKSQKGISFVKHW